MPAGSIASNRAFWFGFADSLAAKLPGAGVAGAVVEVVVVVPVVDVVVPGPVVVVAVVDGAVGFPAGGGWYSEPRP
jgi:hypothetical protein